MKNAIGVDIADAPHRLAHLLAKVETGVARDFTGQNHQVAFGERLTCHPAEWILLEARIKDVIADGVANLIRMAFGDRLGRKDVSAHVVTES